MSVIYNDTPASDEQPHRPERKHYRMACETGGYGVTREEDKFLLDGRPVTRAQFITALTNAPKSPKIDAMLATLGVKDA